jgi:hypothetical protein
MNKLAPLIIVLIIFPEFTNAQDEHGTEDAHHDHHQTYEFGGALGPAYGFSEAHLTGSLHLHLLRNFGPEKNLGAGIGFETLFDEHRHLNFSIPVNYNTGSGLVFTVSPGILWKQESNWESSPSVHLETLYEFMFEKLHIGPMFEFSLARSDIHIMLGIHLAAGFGH